MRQQDSEKITTLKYSPSAILLPILSQKEYSKIWSYEIQLIISYST